MQTRDILFNSQVLNPGCVLNLTSTLHPLCSRVDCMRQGTDDPELGEKGDTTGTLKLRGRTSQMRADPRQRDLRGVRLENHQVSFQLLE